MPVYGSMNAFTQPAMIRRISTTLLARVGLLLLSLGLALLLAFSANGQDYLYTREGQIDLLKRQVALLQLDKSRVEAQLKTCDSILTLTRVDLHIALGERDRRIQALEDSCNSEINRQADYNQQAEVKLYAYKTATTDLQTALTRELLTSRFLGWGRKRALRSILKPLTEITD